VVVILHICDEVKNAWSVELWFFGQGFHDHLEDESLVPPNQIQWWKKINFQLCALL